MADIERKCSIAKPHSCMGGFIVFAFVRVFRLRPAQHEPPHGVHKFVAERTMICLILMRTIKQEQKPQAMETMLEKV